MVEILQKQVGVELSEAIRLRRLHTLNDDLRVQAGHVERLELRDAKNPLMLKALNAHLRLCEAIGNGA